MLASAALALSRGVSATHVNAGHPRCHKTAHPLTVSVRYFRRSRPRRNINYNSEDEESDEDLMQREIGGLDEAQVTAVSVGAKEQGKKISGSVVLLALQKATAQKTLKRKTKKIKEDNLIPKTSAATRKEEEDGEHECSDVRPLCIKRDWSNRLDELEAQLQHLIHT